jgi:hypothetical protein
MGCPIWTKVWAPVLRRSGCTIPTRPIQNRAEKHTKTGQNSVVGNGHGAGPWEPFLYGGFTGSRWGVCTDARDRDGAPTTTAWAKVAPHNNTIRTRRSPARVNKRKVFHFLCAFFMTVVGNEHGAGWAGCFRAHKGGDLGPRLGDIRIATGVIFPKGVCVSLRHVRAVGPL